MLSHQIDAKLEVTLHSVVAHSFVSQLPLLCSLFILTEAVESHDCLEGCEDYGNLWNIHQQKRAAFASIIRTSRYIRIIIQSHS